MFGNLCLGPEMDVSVVICAYTMRRYEDLKLAVASALAQEPAPLEVLVVSDGNAELLEAARADFPAARVMANRLTPGLSGARNTAVQEARGDIVAFLDDDAEADRRWLAVLRSAYTDEKVIGVGGLVVPSWAAGGRPGWLPEEFDWVVGCSYIGLPTERAVVRNPIGANMSFRTAPLRDAGGFAAEVGRIGNQPLGCEETELAIRLARRHPEVRVMFEPAAVVHHHVPTERGEWAYFRARCWSEGLSKAMVARLSDPRRALSAERRYVSRVLPRAVLRGLHESVMQRRPAAAARAGAVVAGLAITAAGYLVGQLRSAQPAASGPRPFPTTIPVLNGEENR